MLDAVAARIERRSAAHGHAVAIDWPEELTLRSRLLGMWPSGRVSASGACRILRASDQWVALSVARPWDHDVLPALVEGPVTSEHWATLTEWVEHHGASEAVDRARLFDMPAAVLDAIPPSAPVPLRSTVAWESHPSGPRPLDDVTVVDLSSLWAGPLVARILRSAGAKVVKVESTSRPDGARATPEFFNALHADEDIQLELDMTTGGGRRQLREVIEHADVVIEASRPRALVQMGVGPEEVSRRAGRVWLSITGYGRRGPGANWVAFGDDAAVAGGLVETDENGEPVFCADAVADPVTGLFGAAAVLASLDAGGGHLIDLSLAGSAAALARGVEPFAGTAGRGTSQ